MNERREEGDSPETAMYFRYTANIKKSIHSGGGGGGGHSCMAKKTVASSFITSSIEHIGSYTPRLLDTSIEHIGSYGEAS